MSYIACNSLAKRVYHFFYKWQMHFHCSDLNNVLFAFSRDSWKYIDRDILFINSKSSREFHNIKSCKMFFSLIRTYRTKLFFVDLCFKRNLFELRSWNLIANSSIAKWFSKTINKKSWFLKTFKTCFIFQNHDALLYDIWELNSTFKWRSITWYRFRLNDELLAISRDQNDWIVAILIKFSSEKPKVTLQP